MMVDNCDSRQPLNVLPEMDGYEEDALGSGLEPQEQAMDEYEDDDSDIEEQHTIDPRYTSLEGEACVRESNHPTVSVLQRKWNSLFERLVDFKRKHGHCLVPNRYSEDMPLGAWVSTQRRQYKILVSGSFESTPMTPERASKLESIGFVWATTDPRHVPWESRYDELVEYKKENGDCLVPIGFKENVRLANWVSTQRQEYKLIREGRTSRLSQERIKLLNDIGFIWEAQRGGPRRTRKPKAGDPEKDPDEDKRERKKAKKTIRKKVTPRTEAQRIADAANGIVQALKRGEGSLIDGSFDFLEAPQAQPPFSPLTFTPLNNNSRQNPSVLPAAPKAPAATAAPAGQQVFQQGALQPGAINGSYNHVEAPQAPLPSPPVMFRPGGYNHTPRSIALVAPNPTAMTAAPTGQQVFQQGASKPAPMVSTVNGVPVLHTGGGNGTMNPVHNWNQVPPYPSVDVKVHADQARPFAVTTIQGRGPPTTDFVGSSAPERLSERPPERPPERLSERPPERPPEQIALNEQHLALLEARNSQVQTYLRAMMQRQSALIQNQLNPHGPPQHDHPHPHLTAAAYSHMASSMHESGSNNIAPQGSDVPVMAPASAILPAVNSIPSIDIQVGFNGAPMLLCDEHDDSITINVPAPKASTIKVESSEFVAPPPADNFRTAPFVRSAPLGDEEGGGIFDDAEEDDF